MPVLALIHHPNLGHSLSGQETPISAGVKRSIKLSLASSRQIADCLVFADLFDAASYCANPFLNQCIFIAGVAFIHDAQSEDLTVGAHSTFLNGLVKQNLSALLKALKRMEVYWNGLGYVISVCPWCFILSKPRLMFCRSWSNGPAVVDGQRLIFRSLRIRLIILFLSRMLVFCGDSLV